ncbi:MULTISPECIES: DUF4236 domain-containing protein [Streptomyces]|uniref:DUF4236 domain-containing protein n=1 Tax=Streptomyces TaxID=1883 RepID=UPI0013DA8A50|nr:DUF4236 domain-containing protein [Streptomyces aureoverticillatus]QIB41834.1 DUF4236 domain-containing protein [Streptomyces aureoverticillatus]
MSFTFHKTFRILPGVRLRINGRSWSLTLGGRHGQHTINSDGRRTSTLDAGPFSARRDHHRH